MIENGIHNLQLVNHSLCECCKKPIKEKQDVVTIPYYEISKDNTRLIDINTYLHKRCLETIHHLEFSIIEQDVRSRLVVLKKIPLTHNQLIVFYLRYTWNRLNSYNSTVQAHDMLNITQSIESDMNALRLKTNTPQRIKAKLFAITECENNGKDYNLYPVTFNSWEEINRFLLEKSLTIKINYGCLKSFFSIEFEDGFTYNGRYDILYRTKEKEDLGLHILSHCLCHSGRWKPSTFDTEKGYLNYINTFPRQIELCRQVLDYYEIKFNSHIDFDL